MSVDVTVFVSYDEDYPVARMYPAPIGEPEDDGWIPGQIGRPESLPLDLAYELLVAEQVFRDVQRRVKQHIREAHEQAQS